MSVDFMMRHSPAVYAASRGLSILGWYAAMPEALEIEMVDGFDGTVVAKLKDLGPRGLDLPYYAPFANRPKYRAGSAWGGQPSVYFDRQSAVVDLTAPPGDWKALHDGTGMSFMVAFRPLAPTVATSSLFGTGNNLGMELNWDEFLGPRFLIDPGGVVDLEIEDLTVRNYVLFGSFIDDQSLTAAQLYDGLTLVEADEAQAVPSSSDPEFPLIIGTDVEFELFELILFGDVIDAEARSFLMGYYNARLTGWRPF